MMHLIATLATIVFQIACIGTLGCPCQDDGSFKVACQRGYDIVYPEEVKLTLGCLCICPGIVKMDYLHEQPESYTWYRKFMGFFVGNSLIRNRNLHQGGVAYYFAEDNATLPLRILKALVDIRQPLLSHAIEITSPEMLNYTVLSPDFHFISYLGFEDDVRELDRQNKQLSIRSPKVFWRGSPTGTGQRVKICLESTKYLWLDFAFSNSFSAESTKFFNDSHIWDDQGYGKITDLNWISHRGVLDIDGNVNAWGLFWRLASFSVVFKVDSNWTNAYTRDMIPWVHYIPILADLSNLANVTQMVASDDPGTLEYLSSIAANARKLVDEHSYEKEVDRVARELSTIFSLPPHDVVAEATEVPDRATAGATTTAADAVPSPSQNQSYHHHHHHTNIDQDSATSVMFRHMTSWHHHLNHMLTQLSHADRVKHLLSKDAVATISSDSSEHAPSKVMRWNRTEFEHHFHFLRSIPSANCSQPHSICNAYQSFKLNYSEANPSTQSCHGLPIISSSTQSTATATTTATITAATTTTVASASQLLSGSDNATALINQFTQDATCTAINWETVEKRNVIIAVTRHCDCHGISFFVKNLRASFSGAEVVIFCTSSAGGSHTDTAGATEDGLGDRGEGGATNHASTISSSSSARNPSDANLVRSSHSEPPPTCSEEGIDSCGDVLILGGEGFPTVNHEVVGYLLVLRWLHRRMHRNNFCTHILLVFSDNLHDVLFQMDPFDFLDKTGAQVLMLQEQHQFTETTNTTAYNRSQQLLNSLREISTQLFAANHVNSTATDLGTVIGATRRIRLRRKRRLEETGVKIGGSHPELELDCVLRAVQSGPLINPHILLGSFEGLLKLLDAVAFVANHLDLSHPASLSETGTGQAWTRDEANYASTSTTSTISNASSFSNALSPTISRAALINYVHYAGLISNAGVNTMILPSSVAFAAEAEVSYRASLRDETRAFHPIDNPLVNMLGVVYSFIYHPPISVQAALISPPLIDDSALAETAISMWRNVTWSESMFCDLYPIEG